MKAVVHFLHGHLISASAAHGHVAVKGIGIESLCVGLYGHLLDELGALFQAHVGHELLDRRGLLLVEATQYVIIDGLLLTHFQDFLALSTHACLRPALQQTLFGGIYRPKRWLLRLGGLVR